MPNVVAESSSCSWDDDLTMPYTLAAGILWFIAALLVGLVAGWVLRSAAAGRQVARARRRQQAESEAEMATLRERASDLERAADERDRLKAELEQLRSANERPAEPVTQAAGTPDLDAAATVLGRRLTHDDLRAISGIGPAIERLCHGIGIRTWWDLATADVSVLKSMLADAGPRFGMHDPTSWPQQARLLAEGRWDEFRALEARLAAQRGAAP
jgi:predicted flap endonuclease-1-like 5' DNA nuclease